MLLSTTSSRACERFALLAKSLGPKASQTLIKKFMESGLCASEHVQDVTMSTDEIVPSTNGIGRQEAKKGKKRARETNAAATAFKKQKKSKTTSDADESQLDAPNGIADSEQVDGGKSKHNQHSEDQRIPETQLDKQSNDSIREQVFSDSDLHSQTPFVQETVSFFLTLSPVAHSFPLEGCCAEHISPLLLTYYPPLNGIVLSYSNPRLSEQPEDGAQIQNSEEARKVLGKSMDEYAVTYIWLTAEFLLLRPMVGTVLEGYVNLQNESSLGLLCYNYFNAGIERARLVKDWSWEDAADGSEDNDDLDEHTAGGRFVDGDGNPIEGRVVFKVKDFEASVGTDGVSGSINVTGTLLLDQDDGNLDDTRRQKSALSG